MTIHVLVEGPSERAFLERWASRLLKNHPIRVHPHQGKGKLPPNPADAPDPKHRELLHQLPAKLRGFANSLDGGIDGVVVLVDADDDDAEELAKSIEGVAKQVCPALDVSVRLAVEETEAFYFGDLKALRRAFPDADMDAARAYVPDSICGTWELFGKTVHDDGGNKVAWAEAMGPVVTTKPGKSRSPSFRGLLNGLLELLPVPPSPRKPQPYRHATKDRRDPGKRR